MASESQQSSSQGPTSTASGPEAVLRLPGEYGSTPIEVLRELRRRHGDVVAYRTLFGEVHLFSHPREVREVLASHNFIRTPLVKTVLGDGLLASDSPHWKRQRRLLAPSFRDARVEELVSLFGEVFRARMEAWPALVEGGAALNLARQMELAALENGTRALFSASVEERFLDDFALVLRQMGEIGCGAAFGASLVRTPEANREFKETMGRIEEDVERIIADRRADPGGAPDMLKVLLDARPGPGGAPLTERQLRDEVVTMLVASHETTAVTLTWASYLLATHPTAAAELRAEVRGVLGGRAVAAADLEGLVYTRMVVDETLRLYPPVWNIAREVVNDDELGGVALGAGAGVLISPFLVHRHEEFWEDPERFEPRRFEGGEGRFQGALAYIPFASGRHLCLGRRFALTEAVVGLATMAQRFRFRLREERAVEIDPLLTLRARGGLWVDLIDARDEGGAGT
ncbi:MAG: cytochrome P450 [Planctomycetota bacterium]|nr:cytochrome P450 [Planctomycetota bacterium]